MSFPIITSEATLLACLGSFLSLFKHRQVAPLYDEAAPRSLGDQPEDIPALTWYPVKSGKAHRSAIVVCPGGGYGALADHEGKPIAEWLNTLGVSAFVLKYRLGPKYHHPTMLEDAARAIRTVRANSETFQVDKDKIGILGFSAGGHLASSISTHFDNGNPQSSDPVERVSSKPNAAILIYPVISLTQPYTHQGTLNNLLGDNPTEELLDFMSSEKQVTSETPPTFLVTSWEDEVVPMENSLLFAEALRRAGVPLELHVYERGPHGFGLGDEASEYGTWPMLCANWLGIRGFRK
jgi:acetyl esterase/lipase